MNCPKCDTPLNTEEIVNEHAEDYGFVKLPSVEWLEEWLDKAEMDYWTDHTLATALHSALQGGKHA